MGEKLPYLVDVPVRLNIWIRPECQRRQFEIVKKARPSMLFLMSDGGRNEKEWAAIRANREMIDSGIDWDCTVYRVYEEENRGLYAMSRKGQALIWSKVDRCIFLEDDHLPSVSFFRYCAELLERYKDDMRICCICGMNHLGVSENVNTDYFFSRQGSIWGTATWKRVMMTRLDPDYFEYGKDPYVMGLLRQRMRHNRIMWKRTQAYAQQAYYEGHAPGGEFYTEFAMYGQNQLQIIPRVNMISNIGCTEDSEHAAALENLDPWIRRVFNMQTHEMEFPMKHARYVIPDVEYEKKRNKVMGYNDPLRAVQITLYRLSRGDFKRIKRSIKRILGRNRQLEK